MENMKTRRSAPTSRYGLYAGYLVVYLDGDDDMLCSVIEFESL